MSYTRDNELEIATYVRAFCETCYKFINAMVEQGGEKIRPVCSACGHSVVIHTKVDYEENH